jgi:hypothetical protein
MLGALHVKSVMNLLNLFEILVLFSMCGSSYFLRLRHGELLADSGSVFENHKV